MYFPIIEWKAVGILKLCFGLETMYKCGRYASLCGNQKNLKIFEKNKTECLVGGTYK